MYHFELVTTLNFMQRKFFYFCRAHYAEVSIKELKVISWCLLEAYWNIHSIELPFQLLYLQIYTVEFKLLSDQQCIQVSVSFLDGQGSYCCKRSILSHR